MRSFFIFFFISFCAIAQRYNSATEYLNFIDRQNAAVVQQTWNYMYVYTQEDDYVKRNGQRKKLENVLKRSLRYVTKEQPFDQELQKAAIAYLKGNIAILKNDYAALLKNEVTEKPSINRLQILRKIRKSMYELRVNYNTEIKKYGSRHDLEIVENDSNLAQQMRHTIAVYDYYNELNLFVEEIKRAEAYLWDNIQNQKPEEFKSRLLQLQSRIVEVKNQADDLTLPSSNLMLKEAFEDFLKAFQVEFKSQSLPIISYLEIYNSDSKKLNAATNEFNEAKTWYNINRREAYDKWSTAVITYLRTEIQPVH